MTKLIITLGILSLSSISFMATFNSAMQFTETPYAWIVSLVGSVIPFYMIRFCTYVLLQVVDAIYVAYVIDLDTHGCHSTDVHSIFGSNCEVVFEQ